MKAAALIKSDQIKRACIKQTEEAHPPRRGALQSAPVPAPQPRSWSHWNHELWAASLPGVDFFPPVSSFVCLRDLAHPGELCLPYVTKLCWNSSIIRWAVLMETSWLYVIEICTSAACVTGGSLTKEGLCWYHLCSSICRQIVTSTLLQSTIVDSFITILSQVESRILASKTVGSISKPLELNLDSELLLQGMFYNN